MLKNEKRNKGEVGKEMAQDLGKEISDMFDSVGRKLYASIVSDVKEALSSALVEHKAELKKAVMEEFGRRGSAKAETHVSSWLDLIVGDAITTIAQEVATELPKISSLMLDEQVEPEDEDEEVAGEEEEETEEEEGEEDQDSDNEEEVDSSTEEEDENASEEDEEEEEEPKVESSKKANFKNDLNTIKSRGLSLVKSISKKNPEKAARLAMILKTI